MRKIINPCKCSTGKTMSNAFVKITYEDGRLSLTGVIGPTHTGNCRGSAGQCVNEIRTGVPTAEWNDEMIRKLCDIWDRWHLNDMRPYCPHQKELGWDEQAKEPVTLYHYALTDAARKSKALAEKAAMDALENGETFTPTKEQSFAACLKSFLDRYDPIDEKLSPFYKLYKSATGRGPTEKKTRGWVRYDESERGILCKPCPVCGYKYGTSWIKEEVPSDVVKWLFDLPDTKINPAWV